MDSTDPQRLARDLQELLIHGEAVVEPEGELWAYGVGRSCRVEAGAPAACTLLLGRAPIARVARAEDLGGVVARWLDGATLAQMRAASPLEAVPHAERLEAGDVAGWHWATVLDRARAGEGALARLHPLVEVAVDRPAIRRFFSFTTLIHLGFSRSSHAPYVTEGMPMASPVLDGAAFDVTTRDGPVCRGDAAESALMLEHILARAPGQPFAGCAVSLVRDAVDDELARQGSALRASLDQRRTGVDVAIAADARRCVIHDARDHACVTLFEPRRVARRELEVPDLAAAVRAARRWIEGAS